MIRSGLGRRIRSTRMKLLGLFRRRERLGSLSVLLTWGFLVAMAMPVGSGGSLYFGWAAGYGMATAHWYATWAVAAFAGVHVIVHYRIGGGSAIAADLPAGAPLPPPPRAGCRGGS